MKKTRKNIFELPFELDFAVCSVVISDESHILSSCSSYLFRTDPRGVQMSVIDYGYSAISDSNIRNEAVEVYT